MLPDLSPGARVRLPGPASVWAYFAGLNSWVWYARPVAYDGTLELTPWLTEHGYQRIDDGGAHDARQTALHGQLADVVTLAWPGSGTRRDRWARREDIERVDAVPVALAFLLPDGAPTPDPRDEEGNRVLPMAVFPPPPQFGERALVLQGSKWRLYALSALGDDGVTLWQQLGAALKRLNTPAEWWMHSPELERAGVPSEYQRMSQDLHSRLLATHGAEREAIRGQIAGLTRLRKNAEKIRKARDRALQDRGPWLAEWEEVQGTAQQLAALYWQAHQAAISVPSVAVLDADDAEPDDIPAEVLAEAEAGPIDAEGVSILAKILETSSAATMDSPNFVEDSAVREASLAPKDEWQAEADVPRFNASNNLAVYFLDREHPLSLTEAQAQLLRIRESTVLTVRIAQGLWNLRRHHAELARNGAAAIRYDEILEWRGVKKHSRLAHPGTSSDERRTDGWRSEDRDDVRRDFQLASRYYLRGQHTVSIKGKQRIFNVDGPYLRVSFVSTPTLWHDDTSGQDVPRDEHLGVFFAPGDWINSYEDAGNYYLAEIDRRVFQLNPQNEQHELKLALYLTERWRTLARDGRYADPIVMSELLRQSVIRVDYKSLTSRFAPRIEQALESLRQRHIIGSYECLTPVDRTKARWGKDWLAARWRVLPPNELVQSYIAKGITRDARQLPPGHKGH